MTKQRTVKVRVEQGDVTTYPADLLVLKYAQGLHGVDAIVHASLTMASVSVELPNENGHTLVSGSNAVKADKVLFVGVKPLYRFEYADIQEFARRAVLIATSEYPRIQHLAITLHGPGYGLDEIEAFDAEVAGLAEGVAQMRNAALGQITFVELNVIRADVLRARLQELVPDGELSRAEGDSAPTKGVTTEATKAAAATERRAKLRIFVAMPFRPELEDHFEYGILRPAKKCGFICERADRETFTDDIVNWVKDRIATADLIVADLTGSNANVYLEVGYAWGLNRRTLLLTQSTDDLRFDVRNHKCLVYKNIRELEKQLVSTLKSLKVDRSS